MSSDCVISVRELTKSYRLFDKPHHRLLQSLLPSRAYSRQVTALSNVSFDILAGETVGVIGRNGSGKSTLLQLICGTLSSTSGAVTVKGRVAALLELGAGFNPEFSGIENVYMNASIFGVSRSKVDEKLDSILKFADIGEYIYQPVKTYSSGMFVRLAFAVIAHLDADVLIIDEALSVGDVFFTQKCMRFLRKFKETGTILFVSHDAGSVVNLCDRVIWLDKGSVQEIGPADQVTKHYLQHHFESGQQSVYLENDENESNFDASSQVAESGHIGGVSDNMAALLLKEEVAEDDGFGLKGAIIDSVQLVDANNQPVVTINGGERVKLRIACHIKTELNLPISGFYITDRLGQIIFGDNTFLSCLGRAETFDAGDRLVAEFDFIMPDLVAGDYAVTVAVGDGTQEQHIIHHWKHAAAAFRSCSKVMHGLIGVSVMGVNLYKN